MGGREQEKDRERERASERESDRAKGKREGDRDCARERARARARKTTSEREKGVGRHPASWSWARKVACAISRASAAIPDDRFESGPGRESPDRSCSGFGVSANMAYARQSRLRFQVNHFKTF